MSKALKNKVKLNDWLSLKDYGAVLDGVTDDTAAVNAGIAAASASGKSILLEGVALVASTINLPQNTTAGFSIRGKHRRCGFKFSGTGTLLNLVSGGNVTIANMTLIGPGSGTVCTGISATTSNSSVGVFNCVYEDLTIEGFYTGITTSGMCHAYFKNITMGLSKSGLFPSTDENATPVIGLNIGTTTLACVFSGLIIFAKQRCVQILTSSQISEGLYFQNCTFDLRYNDGTSNNQNAVYIESGQDIKFQGCWATNSEKYDRGVTSFNDTLIRINHDKGAISAPLVGLVFDNFVLNGNGIQCSADNTVDNDMSIEGGQWVLQTDLGPVNTFSGFSQGFRINGLTIKAVGSSGGVGVNNYSSPWLTFSNITKGLVSDMRGLGKGVSVGTISNGYLRVSNCNDFRVYGCVWPTQTTLTPGSEVVVDGTYSDVVVIGEQQTQARQFTSVVSAGTYNAGTPTIASVNTFLNKPRMARVEVNMTSVTTSSGGFLEINQGSSVDRSILFTTLAPGNIYVSRDIVVSGNVTLSWVSGGNVTVSANSSHLKVTLI